MFFFLALSLSRVDYIIIKWLWNIKKTIIQILLGGDKKRYGQTFLSTIRGTPTQRRRHICYKRRLSYAWEVPRQFIAHGSTQWAAHSIVPQTRYSDTRRQIRLFLSYIRFSSLPLKFVSSLLHILAHILNFPLTIKLILFLSAMNVSFTLSPVKIKQCGVLLSTNNNDHSTSTSKFLA